MQNQLKALAVQPGLVVAAVVVAALRSVGSGQVRASELASHAACSVRIIHFGWLCDQARQDRPHGLTKL